MIKYKFIKIWTYIITNSFIKLIDFFKILWISKTIFIDKITSFKSNCIIKQFIKFLYISCDLIFYIICIDLKTWILAQTMCTMITVDGFSTSIYLSAADNCINWFKDTFFLRVLIFISIEWLLRSAWYNTRNIYFCTFHYPNNYVFSWSSTK